MNNEKILCDKQDLVAIADSIRARTGTTETYRVPELGTTVSSIMGGGVDLPIGYERINFIQFDGSQIIDTKIVCNQNTKIRVLFSRESTREQYLYGTISSDHTASVTAFLSSGGAWRFGNSSLNRTLPVSTELVQTAIIQKDSKTINEYTQTISNINNFEAIGSLIIGGVRYANGDISSGQFVGKIFLFEIWNESEKLLQLIPVKEKNDTFRFYDTISKIFFDSITDTPLKGGFW